MSDPHPNSPTIPPPPPDIGQKPPSHRASVWGLIGVQWLLIVSGPCFTYALVRITSPAPRDGWEALGEGLIMGLIYAAIFVIATLVGWIGVFVAMRDKVIERREEAVMVVVGPLVPTLAMAGLFVLPVVGRF